MEETGDLKRELWMQLCRQQDVDAEVLMVELRAAGVVRAVPASSVLVFHGDGGAIVGAIRALQRRQRVAAAHLRARARPAARSVGGFAARQGRPRAQQPRH